VTTYKAVKVGNVRPGDLVVISGVGGRGHLAVQYAKIFGGTVAAVDITDEKLELATSVIGSIVGTRADLMEVFGLHAAGRTRVIYETRPLASVNDAISEVLHGKAKARLVLEP